MLSGILLTLAAAAQTPTAFSPPLDQAMILTIARDQTEGGRMQHFEVKRRIRFVRDGNGLIAELTTLGADGDDRSASGDRFENAMASLKGQTIRYRLDDSGAVISIANRQAIWDALIAAIAKATTGGDTARARLAKQVSDRLATLPAAQQRSILGSMIGTAIEETAARRGVVPVTHIERPARPPFGASQNLTGTERAWRDGRLLVVEQRTAADLAIPGKEGGTAHVETTETRRLDPASGLLVESRSTARTVIGGAEQLKVTEISVSPAPVS